MAQSVRSLAGSNNSYKPITNAAWVRTRLCRLQKGCTRLAAASDKVYQLLAHGQWLSPGTPASSTTKTGRHDIAEILLKVALKHQKSNQNQSFFFSFVHCIVCSSSNCGCILSPFYFVKLLLQPSNTDN